MEFERFLRYSLRHNRPVRVLVQEETMRYMNLTVIAMEEDGFSFRKAGRKTPGPLRYDQVLAVSYARGDDGDTLKNAMRETDGISQQNAKDSETGN